MRFSRRDFLQAVVVTASAVPFAGCSADDEEGGPETYSTDPEDVLRVFPQGVASGDPKPDSVVLWTRAVPSAAGAVTVSYEVSTDESFGALVAKGKVTTSANADYTVRIKPVGLSPYTQYYYRFKAAGAQSDVGRTKTAPEPGQDQNIRFAFASCQDFIGRYYHSWQALLETEDPVDFVVFLGDYVYETNGNPSFQLSSSKRRIEIADGLVLEEGEPPVKAALTLADYRGLYQQYRSDPQLKKAHQLFPFICIWDDHEFANDAWQDHATDFNELQGDEKSTERRESASQAWFEYQPADVEWRKDASFPQDITIYRRLRFGKHMDLVLTDQRSYRSDHVIAEGASVNARPPGAPSDLPTYGDAGKLQPHSSLGSRNFVKKPGFDALEAYVSPTMLGAAQKQWLLDALSGSDATWKIWGNQTQLLQMVLDLEPFASVPIVFRDKYYFTVDQWDGYRSERKEILSALSGVDNVVAITGDIHAFYASELQVDFDAPGVPVAVEYVTAGISSSPAQEITAVAVKSLDPNGAFGLAALVPDFDQVLNDSNAHYKYNKSFAHGISVMEVSAAEVRVTYLHIADVKSESWDGQVEKVVLRTPAGQSIVELV
ncbi:MAG: alkaline phosphatase D family protein [Polyangiaceae bacterium]|nr:alkaline phosphatase D family protein [Polyangiaceae bacterium]